ncbi:replication-relaxation family protein [Streptomyces sp. WAC05858]|uniref:replication-relaxation family protein n=1 Tax=Streptomyces TaxID=1883 RepID=UPI00163D0FEC|nr:replication-relaxation family protein [Streptomyces sp. WAC05858]
MSVAGQWPYKSTGRVRALVLLALGVVKVATAEQLRQLVLPGTADPQTVRNACKDLRHAGLVETVGKTSQLGAGGRPVARQLWNLTTAGLAAAASELGRPVKEMGGTAREAAKAGAAHALAVTDTIDAIRQSPPLPTSPVGRRAAVPVPRRALPARPAGLGHLAGWETEVALPVAGTFTAPGKGSLRADAVLQAPEDGVPVLFVEVDNHTEPPATVAAKINRYRTFFQRKVKDHQGRDVELWSTVWEDSGRGGYPPLALVFTKDVGPEARRNRMTKVAELSRDCWHGRWQRPGAEWGLDDAEEQDGWHEYAGTVPVIATHLDQLRTKGPHGPVWWRFGRTTWQSLNDALTNTDTHAEYFARSDARQAAREAQRPRGWGETGRELEEQSTAHWPCPSCGRDVDPDHTDTDGYRPEAGGLCPLCERTRRELEAERSATQERTGIMGRLRTRAAER